MNTKIDSCITSLDVCAKLFENIVNDLKEFIKSKPDSDEDYRYLRNKYSIAVGRFKSYVMKENLTRERFVRELKEIIKLLNILLQNFKNEIIPVVEKYEAQNAIPNINKLPALIEKILRDLNDYSTSARAQINSNQKRLENASQSFNQNQSYQNNNNFSSNNNTSSTNMSSSNNTFNSQKGNVFAPAPPLPSRSPSTGGFGSSYNNYSSGGTSGGLFNPYQQESIDLFLENENKPQGGIFSNIISSGTKSIAHMFKILTFKEGSLDKAIQDMSDNVHNLHNKMDTTLDKNTWAGTKEFFKSTELWRSIAGLLGIVGVIYLIMKILRWIKNFFTGRRDY